VFICTISLNFEIYFLNYIWEIVFGLVSDNCFRKYKKDCNILKVTMVPGLIHYKLKLLDFLSDFVLIF